MADVIGCQQKTARAICIFAPEYPNTRDTAKHQSHQQFTRVIRFAFGLDRLSFLLSRQHGIGYFSG